jgi:predicted transcriptional regulator
MQITLSSQQSKILESLCLQGGYRSLEDTIDSALILLAEEITSHNSEEKPEYLAWVAQTRLKIEEGLQSSARGEVLEINEVLSRLRNKVETAKAASR